MERPWNLTLLAVGLLVGVGIASGCTDTSRNDVVKSAFIKAVNLKCKVSKSEARFAWDLAGDLGADDQARSARAKASAATARLLADVDRLDGPADVATELTKALRSSQQALIDVNRGRLTPDQAKAKFDELRQSARDQGFGECVSS